jgi:formate hydrogenlyase transcriptional activator
VPALRERAEDIPLLVRHFVQEFSRRNNRVIDTVPSEAMEAMVRYSWPGNIRELQNVIERAVIVSKSLVLSVAGRTQVRRGNETRFQKSRKSSRRA